MIVTLSTNAHTPSSRHGRVLLHHLHVRSSAGRRAHLIGRHHRPTQCQTGVVSCSTRHHHMVRTVVAPVNQNHSTAKLRSSPARNYGFAKILFHQIINTNSIQQQLSVRWLSAASLCLCLREIVQAVGLSLIVAMSRRGRYAQLKCVHARLCL